MDAETKQQLVNKVNVNTTEWQTRLIKILDGYTKKEEQAINLSIRRIVVFFFKWLKLYLKFMESKFKLRSMELYLQC